MLLQTAQIRAIIFLLVVFVFVLLTSSTDFFSYLSQSSERETGAVTLSDSTLINKYTTAVPVLYFHFNNDLKSAAQIDNYVAGTPTFGATGIEGESLYFDGSGSHNLSISFANTYPVNDFSIGFWLKRTDLQTRQNVFSLFGNNIQFYITGTDAITDLVTVSNTHAYLKTKNIDANWHHFVITEKAGVLTQYLDGQKTAQYSSEALASRSPRSLLLGSFSGDNRYPAHGWLDEFALYGGAMSDQDVARSYADQKSRLVAPDLNSVGCFYAVGTTQSTDQKFNISTPKAVSGTYWPYVHTSYNANNMPDYILKSLDANGTVIGTYALDNDLPGDIIDENDGSTIKLGNSNENGPISFVSYVPLDPAISGLVLLFKGQEVARNQPLYAARSCSDQ